MSLGQVMQSFGSTVKSVQDGIEQGRQHLHGTIEHAEATHKGNREREKARAEHVDHYVSHSWKTHGLR